ncbi:AAA domain-containing protein [Saccharothrix carnea]|uniref:Nuclease SbcCD subunit C n=1 Tax=Saccharothrix carnea TaxID=1280637 RepID=A0A2P8HZ78_SACCR|nr:AAA family ATPase [Saccharothrix carnea]PSL51538.1 AAA domain-containing protein [Saccharothrix carnea]
MTVRFRIDALGLDTTEGSVEYRFTSDLTVLAGPTGVGKTTLLELIKFGFGANAILAPVAVEHVESVTLEVRIGDERLRLTRSLDKAKRAIVRVTDLITRERLQDHHIGDKRQPALNTLLMRCLGLPDDMRAAAGGNSTREGARITFADILTYLYIPQGEINRDIAHSQESYREPKRKAVFELLFGLTDREILALRSAFSRLKGEIDIAETQHDTVVQFLRDSGTSGREEAELAFERAQTAQQEAESSLVRLRESIDPVTDRETQTLRDLLTEAERGLADTRAAETDLTRGHAQYTAERRRVQADLDRLDRMREAGQRLADIEFTVCPRCMQSLRTRSVPANACRLCLQDDSAVPDQGHDQYEVRQLTEQLLEMDRQLDALVNQREAVSRAVADRQQLIAHLTTMLDSRTEQRVTPRLQAFSDASQQVAKAKAEQQHWEAILRQWDAVADLQAATDQLRTDRENVRSRIDHARRALELRHAEIIEEISEEFDATVRAIGIPSITTASVDSEKYLPVLNGKIFSKDNQLSGGVTTATQVAYWCSLLAVAMRHPETTYPAFLLIDSPRLALNTATNLTAAMYRRLTTQVGVLAGRLQIIIADNELPDTYRGHYAQVDFDYRHPTVSTVDHPGPANVTPIHETTSNETTD